jgi:MarR family transcriptional regulator for hemolysin
MKRTQLAIRRRMDDQMAQYGLTAAQGEILGPVAHSLDGIAHKELAEWLGVSSPTLSNLVDTLIGKGLVERRVSPDDARVKRIYATEAGRTLMMEIVREAGQKMDELLDGFNPQELAHLTDYLQRIARNAGDSLDIPDELRRRVEEARRHYGLTLDGKPISDEC